MMETIRVDVGPIELELDAWGDTAAPPLLLLHGGGQTRHAWSEAGPRLAAQGWRVLSADLRGHGESGWAPDGDYALERHADDLRALAKTLSRPPVVVGASLGGLAALIAAGEAPQLPVRALVVVDVAHRAHRSGIDRILTFMRSRPDGFASLDEAAEAVAAYLPHRAPPPDVNGLRRNLRRRGDRWVWHWDPRLLQGNGPDTVPLGTERLLSAARGVAGPIVVVRGGASDVIDETIAAEFCDLVFGATHVEVARAGHMVAGDRNDRFVAAMIRALSALRPEVATPRPLLRERRADAIAHPGGTLLAHLDRTAARLALWGAPDALVRAGRSHAAYGTDGFATALLSLDERGVLAERIGAEAEAIVYAYCALDRSVGLPGDADAPLRDRFTGQTFVPDASMRRALRTLTCANEIDVLLNAPLTEDERHELVAHVRDVAQGDAAAERATSALLSRFRA